MELEYNGVRLELLSLERVERVNVYTRDGMDLLYTNWFVSASCVYAAGGYPVGTAVKSLGANASASLYPSGADRERANGLRGSNPTTDPVDQTRNNPPPSYREPGGSDFTGEFAGKEFAYLRDYGTSVHPYENGYPAAMTDAVINNRLMTPRKELKITAYDKDGKPVVWLQSPRPGYKVDAANGPFPIACSVVEATGEGQSFGVHFQIKTAIVPVDPDAERLILSHRWQMTHTHDEDYYLTRVIQGEIIFHPAVVDKYEVRPDWFRNQLIHPIPLGFQRKNPVVAMSSDGLTLAYTVHDVDPTVTFDPGNSGATQIHIAEKMGYNSPWGM